MNVEFGFWGCFLVNIDRSFTSLQAAIFQDYFRDFGKDRNDSQNVDVASRPRPRLIRPARLPDTFASPETTTDLTR